MRINLVKRMAQESNYNDKARTFLHIRFRGKDYFFTRPYRYEGSHNHKWWVIGTIKKEMNCTAHEVYGLNRIPMWRHKMWLWYLKKTFKYFKCPEYRCHGCGEGVIKYSIADPNYKLRQPGKKRWLVCENCVEFYDQHWSRRRVRLV